NLELALENPLVGAEHLLFVLLQRRRDEALAAGNRLLAVVIGRDGMEVRLRDLDVVPEDAVVADLQRRDAGSRPLALLHLRDDLFPRSTDRLDLVELVVDSVPRETPVAGKRRRVVDEGLLDAIADVGEIVELRDERLRERRLEVGEQRPDAGHEGERLPKADEIARAGGAERGACHEPLEI